MRFLQEWRDRRRNPWRLRPGDLPSPRALRLEPPLRGIENNPVFRMLIWRSRKMGKLFEGRGAIPVERFLEDLWASDVSPAVVACGFWGFAARQDRLTNGLRRTIAGILICLLLAAYRRAMPSALLIPVVLLEYFFLPPISYFFGYGLGALVFDPYSWLRSAKRDMKCLARHFERMHPMLAFLLACVGLAIVVPSLSGLLILAAFLIDTIGPTVDLGFWNFVIAWTSSCSSLELCSMVSLLMICTGFALSALAQTTARRRRRDIFLDLTREAAKAYRLWREAHDGARPRL